MVGAAAVQGATKADKDNDLRAIGLIVPNPTESINVGRQSHSKSDDHSNDVCVFKPKKKTEAKKPIPEVKTKPEGGHNKKSSNFGKKKKQANP
jgi:hypothetical protein